MNHNKLWKILEEIGIPNPLTCLLRNLYAGQEATVRTGHGTTDWIQIGKGICQATVRTGHETTDWFQIGKGVCRPAYLTYMQSTS